MNKCALNMQPFISQVSALSNICLTVCELSCHKRHVNMISILRNIIKKLLEKGMAAHSGILAWRIPWSEEPGGLQSMGSHIVRHD